MYDTGKKIKINRKDIEDAYSKNKENLLNGIKNVVNEKGSITLESLALNLWMDGVQTKFQNRYIFEMCLAMALKELVKTSEIEEENWMYKRK